MIFNERATQNIVPDHLPNLIKFFKDATDEFFDAKKAELTKQIQFLMSCMKENMRWEENLVRFWPGEEVHFLWAVNERCISLCSTSYQQDPATVSNLRLNKPQAIFVILAVTGIGKVFDMPLYAICRTTNKFLNSTYNVHFWREKCLVHKVSHQDFTEVCLHDTAADYTSII